MHRSRLVAFLTTALLLAGSAGRARAAENRLGQPWEDPILEGIARQDQERETRGPDVILRQAELLASRPSDAATHVARLYLLARAYALAGDVPSATATYREVLQQAPTCYFVHHDLAMLALQGAHPDQARAEQELRAALAVHPRYVTALRKLARLEFDGKRWPEAVDSLRKVVSLDPSDLQARFLLTKALLANHDLDAAEQELVLLLRQDPKNPAFRELKGDAYLARGRLDDALVLYRQLAVENPGVAQPLHKVLAALERIRDRDKKVDRDAWIWALEGLYRLEQDPTRKEKLRKALDGLRAQGATAPPEGTSGPPTDDQLVRILGAAPDDVRVQVLRYVYARPLPPEKPLLLEVMRRMSANTETCPEVRQWVLRVLGRFGGRGLVGLLRHALRDPDAAVRTSAVDALLRLAESEPASHDAVFLVLGLQSQAPDDPALAAVARGAVLSLAKATLPEGEGGGYGDQSRAFAVWWAGPVAVEAKIRALASFDLVADPWPEDVLVPYLSDPDPFVVEAAWRAAATAAERLEKTWRARDAHAGSGTPPAEAARRAWWGALPAFVPGALRGPDAAAARARLAAWAAARP